MKRFSLLLTFIFLQVCSFAQSTKVLIAAAADQTWAAEVRSKLLSTGFFSQVDLLDVRSVTPTVSQLQAYNAVLTFTDGGYADPTTMGNNLATYVNGGGGVVEAMFIPGGNPIAGTMATSAYQVIIPGSTTVGTATLGTVALPSHAVMQGVSSFNGGSSSYRSMSTTLASGAYTIASYNSGQILVAAKDNVGPANAKRVDLNFYPPSSDSRGDFWISSTSGARLMANALVYVASKPAATGLHFVGGNGQNPSVYDYVSIPDNGTLDLGNTYTIESWIYLDDASNNTIIDKGDYRYLFETHPNGRTGLGFFSAAMNDWVYSAGTVPTGSWQHVAVTMDAVNHKVVFYLNGNVLSTHTTTNSGGTITTAAPDNGIITIGMQQPSSCQCNNFDGKMDELRIWNRVLCQSEIQNNMNCELNPSGQNGLQALYHFNQGNVGADNSAISTVTDATTNGNNGTLTNFAKTGLTSNWTTGNATGTCTVFTPLAVTAGSNSPVTAGGAINLTATASGSGSASATYAWTGPNSFSNATQNPTVTTGAYSVHAGTYNVTATANGCTATSSTNVVVNTPAATGLNFDGTNDHVQVADNSAFNTTTYTAEAWINVTSSASLYRHIIGRRTSTTGWNLFITSANKLVLWNGYSEPITGPTVNLNTWTHVAVTGDASGQKLYMNGALVGSTSSVVIPATGQRFMIGLTSDDNSWPFSGSIDEVRFWSRALCQSEIQNNMNCELNPSGQANLVALYHLNQGNVGANNSAINIVTDAAGSNNGTMTNFAKTGLASNWTTGNATGTCSAFTPLAVTAGSNSPVTAGAAINLTATASGSGSASATFAWTGPNSFTNATQNPTVTTNAQSVNAGTYNVTATANGCTATGATAVVVNVPVPVLGTYAATAITNAGGNTTITPSAAPSNTTGITAVTSSNFKGKIIVDPVTGVVKIADAYPAGTYTIKLIAYNAGTATSNTSFTLTVGNTFCSQGEFYGTTTVATAATPRNLVVGDFNNDGRQDFICLNAGTSTVSVRLGDGAGGFTSSTNVSIGGNPQYIAAADFNGDGKLDFVCANGSPANTISVRLGDGTGNFTSTADVTAGNFPQKIAIGDFNADGKPDMAFANGGGNVFVRLGDGAGGFTGSTTLTASTVPAAIAVGDFNGDGIQDLAIVDIVDNNVSIRLGDGSGGFTGTTNVATSAGPNNIIIADFNGDGRQDFATTNQNSSTVSVRIGDGTGGFSGTTNISVGSNPLSLDAGDINGDGRMDIVTSSANTNNVYVLQGDGAGNFTNTNTVSTGSGTNPNGIALGDFNNDGHLDFVTGNQSTSNVSVRLGAVNEVNVKSNSTSITDGDNTPSVTDNTDFGNVAPSSSSPKVFTIENTGTGNLTVSSIALTGVNAAEFAVGGITLPATVAANSSATFTVTFTPTSLGSKTATLTINNNDCDEAVYDFALQGTGSCPVIVPTITAGGPTTFCSGGSVTLTTSAGSSYLWSNGATTSSINVATSGSYTVTVTTAGGCSATSAATTVTVNPIPVITGTTPASRCGAGTLSLAATSNIGTLNWYATPQDTFAAVVMNPFGLTDPGDYNRANFGDLDGDGDYDILTTNTLSQYKYFQNTGTASAPAYAAPVTNPFGISGATSMYEMGVFVDLDADGDLDIMGGSYNTGGNFYYRRNIGTATSPNYAAPQTNPFSLSALGGLYVWGIKFGDMDGDGDLDMFAGNSSNSIYYYQNTGTATSPVFAGWQANPFSLGALPVSASYAMPAPIDMDGDGDYDLLVANGNRNWYYYPNNGTTTSPSFGAMVTNPFGLTAVTGSYSMSDFADLDADGDLDIMSGNNAGDWHYYRNILSGTPIATGSPFITPSLSTTTTYYVSATSNGCTSPRTAVVATVNPVPTPTISAGGPTAFCAGGSVTLTASAGSSYLWSPGGATTSSITATNSGSYTVTVTNASNCSATSSAITVTANPIPTVNAVANQTLCSGSATGAISFTGAVPGTTFNWTNNTPSVGLAASGTGDITSFTATNATSSPVTATVTVTPVKTTVTAGGGGQFAYIPNFSSNTVSVINTTTNTVAATIPVSSTPFGAAISPDGSKVYITHLTGNGNVDVISTVTNTVIATITGIGTSSSAGAVVSPDGTKLYVTFDGNNKVAVINTATNTLITNIAVGSSPRGIAMTPDGSKIYVANLNGATVSVINTATNAVTSVGVGSSPNNLSISPDGSKVYVPNLSSNTLSVINTTTNAVSTVNVGNGPWSAITSLDGAQVYVTNVNANTVSVINTATNAITATISGFSAPSGAAVSSDGAKLFVSNRAGNSVSVVNTATNTISGSAIAVGSSPYSLGNFILNATATTCTGTPQTFDITVNPLPIATITAGGPTTFCAGGSVTLTASAGSSYLWSNGATTQSINVTQSGSYTVTVTNANNCAATSTATAVTVNPTPTATISAGGPTTFCQGGSVTLTASAGSSYLWSNGATTQSINATTSGNYTVTITNANNCSATSAATSVTVNPLPAVSLSFASSNTQGASFNNASSAGYECILPTQIQGQSFTATSTGLLGKVSIDFSASGCAAVTQYTVTADLLSGDGLSGSVLATKTVTVPLPYSRAMLDFVFNTPVSVTNGQKYTIRITPNSGQQCSGNEICAAWWLEVNTPYTSGSAWINGEEEDYFDRHFITYMTTGSGNSVCVNAAPFTLTGGTPTGGTFSGNGVSAGIFNPATAGVGTHTITYTYTNANSCTNTATATITVNPQPTATISAGGPTTFCSGGSVTLAASAGSSYLWSPGGATTQSINVTNSGNYTVTVTNANTCSATSAATTVTVNPLPTPSIAAGGPTTFCQGGSVTLTASAGSSYLWSNGATTQSINATTSGNYTVTVTNSNNCSATSAATTVVVNPTPVATISAGGATAFCSGGSVTLTSSAGSSYSWSPGGATTQSINVTASGSYTVTVTNANNCSGTSAATVVTVNPLPTAFNVSGGGSYCSNGSSNLTIGLSSSQTGVNYQLMNGSNAAGSPVAGTGSSISFGIQSAVGTYTVVATNASTSCSSNMTGNATISITNIADPTVVSPVNANCGQQVALSATPISGNSIQWYTVSSGGSPFANGNNTNITPTAGVTYYAEAFIAAGSGAVSGIGTTAIAAYEHNTVTGDDRGGIAISPNYVYYTGDNSTGRFNKSDLLNPTSLQQRDGFFSDISNGNLWQLATSSSAGASLFGGGVIDRLYGLNENLTTNGTVRMLSQAITLNSNSGIAFIASGSGFVIFYAPTNQGYYKVDLNTGTVTLLATGGPSFSFQGPESWASYGWAEYDGANYYIIYVANFNTIAKRNVTTGVTTTLQTFSSLSDMAAIIFDPSNNRMYFHHEGGSQFRSGDETIGMVNVTATAGQQGAASCTSARVPVVVNVTPPTASITVGGPTTFCQGGSVTLTANSGASYLWSNGATSQSINVTQSGSYSVTVTSAPGCAATSSSVAVTVNPLPVATITAGGATTFCAGGSVTLTASAGSSYLWSPGGATTQSINATASGNYTVTVTNANNCSATSAATIVTVNPLPTASITAGGPTTFCQGGSVTLNANGSGVGGGNSLTAIANNFNNNIAAIVSPITSKYNFTMDGGLTGINISDGGNDMYDGGNNLNTNFASNIQYTQNTITNSTVFGTGSSYFTSYNNGVFMLAADMNGVTSFGTTGNLGADGGGSNNGYVFTLSIGGSPFKCYYRQVYNAGDPSINQMIILPGNPSATHTFASNTDDGTHTVSGITGTRLYYYLWAGSNGLFYNTTQVNAIATAFLTQIGAGSSLNYLWSNSATTASTTVNASGNYTVTVTDANGCSATSAPATVTVNPLPTVFNVTGSGTFCAVSPVGLSGSETGISYQLMNGVNTVGAAVTGNGEAISFGNQSAGTYTVVATNTATGCISNMSGNAVININSAPALTACPSNMVLFAGAGCNATTAYTVNATGTPAPSFSYTFSGATTGAGTGTGSGSIFNTGITTVTVTAVNSCGSVDCIFTVTVRDTTRPVVNTQNLTVYLDAAGNASITPAQVNNNSTDNCGVASMSLNTTSFNCSNVGGNNRALDFDGTDDVVVANYSNSQMGIQGTSFTATAWIKRDDFSGQDRAVLSNNGCLLHLIVRGNRPYLGFCGNDIAANTVINPGTWYHIAWVYNAAGGIQSIYVNGVLDVSGAGHGTLGSDAPFRIGAYGTNGAGAFDGKIDEVTLWNSALNAGQINTIMNTSPAPNTPGLIGYWNMEEGSGATLTDRSSAGHNGTLTNMNLLNVWSSDHSPSAGGSSNTVTLTVTDVNGNTNTGTANITVLDTTRPVVSCPGNIVVTVPSGQCNATVSFAATATDNCSATISYSQNPGTVFPVGVTTVTATAKDPTGNTAVPCTFTVTVNAPEINVTGNSVSIVDGDNTASAADGTDFGGTNPGVPVSRTYTIQNAGTSNLTVSGISMTGTDASSFAVSGMSFPATIAANSSSAFTVTFSATALGFKNATVNIGSDDCDEARYDFAVRGEITCAPASFAVCPENINVNASLGQCNTVVNYISSVTGTPAPNITYTFSGATIASGSGTGTGSTFNVGTTTVTINATNPCSNVNCTFTVTVNDNQNPIVVTRPVTVQLDASGHAGITVNDIDDHSTDNCGIATLSVSPNTFDCSNVGDNTVTLTVTDIHGNTASNTAVVTVEDHVAPVALAHNLTVQLDASGNASITPADVDAGSSDACGVTLSVSPNTFTCDNVGPNTVTLTVTDHNNNISTTTAVVTVEDHVAPIALAHDLTVHLDASGNASITPADVDAGSNDACGVTLSVSPNTFTCANVGENTVTLTVTDHNNNVSTVTAVVTVEDHVAPIALAHDLTVQLDASGNASITPADVDAGSNDACGVTLSVSPNTFTCANVGPNTVTLTVTDHNNNVSTTTAVVTVEDHVAPIALAHNLTVQLDASGNASITPADVDAGSNDACGVTLSVSPNTFTCANVGENTVTLTVTDHNNNVSTVTAVVTVEDHVAPIALAHDLTVQLDANGNASITPADVDAGSNDACGVTLSVSPNTFTCANVGENTVTLTVTDHNNNVSTVTAVVTVEDHVAPIALAHDLTVQLDASGNASITPADVDAGSNDACGVTLSVSPNTFTCANVGENTVTLTVTDHNNNVSTTTAVVTVEDHVAPIALAHDLTVQLDASGNTSITPADVDAGSNDACGVTLSVSPNTFTCSNVGPNTVTLTVTDHNNNVSTVTAVVTVEDHIAPIAIAQNVTAYLDATGHATVTAAQVNNGSNDACGIHHLALSKCNYDCSNVGANNVVLTVTDNNSNSSTAPAVVTILDTIKPVVICSANVVVSCQQTPATTGTATATDNCSVANIAFTDASTYDANVNAPAHYDYTISRTWTATDVNGNSSSCTQTITVHQLHLAANLTHVLCYGNSTGKVDLTVMGGIAPLSYSWSNGATTEDISSLTLGTYNVTVTDAAGCTVSGSYTITQPAASLSATVSVSPNPTVAGQQANTIFLGYGPQSVTLATAAAGGTSGYTYSWSPTTGVANATAGTTMVTPVVTTNYVVTVTDAHGCVTTVTRPIYVIDVRSGNNKVIVCHNGNSLSISSSAVPAHLAHGDYLGQCFVVSGTITNVNCNGGNNGAVNTTTVGAAPPYSYSWSNGATTEDISGLTAGNYLVTVTSADGRTTSNAFTVTQPSALAISSVVDNVNCYGGSDGDIYLSVSGGTYPYSYKWNNNSTDRNRYNLAAGTYSVTVTDANGCTKSATFTITQPAAPVAITGIVTDATCNGEDNGSIDITVTGGTAPYYYYWNDGNNHNRHRKHDCHGWWNNWCGNHYNNNHCSSQSQDIDGVEAGTYTVTVVDANGCSKTMSFTIDEPDEIVVTEAKTNVSCNGGSNGTITLSVTGGTAPYTYKWNNNSTAQNRTGLTAGTYSVVVTDAHGCTETETYTITQPAQILTSVAVANVSCNGANNGSINLTVSGGTSPYTYNWSNNAHTQDISNLAPGTYNVNVIDANGCTAAASATITQPNVLAITGTVGNVSCNNDDDGSIDITVTGGTAPYTYDWDDNNNSNNCNRHSCSRHNCWNNWCNSHNYNNSCSKRTQDINSLEAGIYTVTVTDAKGCSKTMTFTVTEPTAISLAGVATNPSCNGSSNGTIILTVSGGTAPFTYKWNNNVTTKDRSNLPAGTYSVTVTDANGCTKTASYTMTQPSSMSASTNISAVTCNGSVNGAVFLTVSGGTTPYSYSWSNGATTKDITGLTAGNYTVTITDAGGCSITKTATVTQPAALVVTGTVINVSCNSDDDGEIDLNVSGGTAPYSYRWNNNLTCGDRSGLSAGSYNVTVTDARGCTATASFTVTQPNAITVAGAVTNVLCNGGSTGAINTTVTGGTAPYTYKWSGSGNYTSANRTGLAIGTYTVTVKDAHGCEKATSFTVTQPTAVAGTITVNPNPTVSGQATNTIFKGYGAQSVTLTAAASGGTAPYSYSWSPATGLSSTSAAATTATPSATTTYTATITDANGCVRSVQVTITVKDVRDGDKIKICHSGSNLSVLTSQLSAHLAHGDYLGACENGNGNGHKLDENGITPLSVSELKVYPNPTTGMFMVELPEEVRGGEAVILDMDGKLVEKKMFLPGTRLSFDLSYVARGIYMIQVSNGGNIYRAKVTIQ